MKNSFNSNTISFPNSCRSYSSKNFTKTFEKPFYTRHLLQNSTEDIVLQSSGKRTSKNAISQVSLNKNSIINLSEIKEKAINKSSKNSESLQNFEKRENLFTLEKAKLEHRIELLEEELRNCKTEKKPAEEVKLATKTVDYEELYKISQKNLEKSKISYAKLQHTLGQFKDQTKLLQNIVDSYQDVKSALESQIQVLKSENLLKNHENTTLQERIWMQQEEIYAKSLTLYEIASLKKERNMLQTKLNQLEVGIISGNIQTVESEEFVSTNDSIFQLVKNPEKYKPRNIKRDSKFIGLDPNLLNLNSIKSCKPTFASFLKIPSGHIQFNPPSKDWLFLTVRAILDSKYYEHIYCNQNNMLPATFPEFVYDWLGIFYVDNVTRSIKQLEWWAKANADDFRIQLLAGLSLARSKKIWELNNFREFLLEELDLDELGFFLHCRFLLFRGPQMTHSSGRFLSMQYVPLLKAKELIKNVMQGLSQEGMEQLLEMVALKSKKKNGLVESSFVLRVLLEYYHREKKLKFLAIQELFYKCSKSEFTFQSFKDICMALDNTLSPFIIAKCYRDAFTEGNGYISPEVFFAVANNSLFYHMLRLKSQWKIPKLNEYGEIDGSFNEYSAHMAKTDLIYKKHRKDIEIVSKFIENLGIPDFQRHVNKVEGILHRKYQVLEDFKHWNLADIFKQFWLAVYKAKNVYYEHNYLMNPSNRTIESKEKELYEIANSSNIFINDIYQFNLNIIASKILLRRFQKKAKNRNRAIQLMKNVVKTVGMLRNIGGMKKITSPTFK